MDEQTTIEGLLDEILDLIEKAWSLPLSGGKVFVDADELRQVVEEIREFVPEEISRAKDVLLDKEQIIERARKDAADIVRLAEDKARTLVNQDTIVKQAQSKANELISQSQSQSKEIKKASNEYVDDLIKRADASLSDTLAELRRTRVSLQAKQKEI